MAFSDDNTKRQYFSKKIIQWYRIYKRDLPWRETKDPYKIWLSEVILQQTRVDQGLPYYERFIRRFPDVATLAKAEETEVMRLWQGLGYYSRARNLHHTAGQVAFEHKGKFPESYGELIKLKGIGRYTAAAIASFSYREHVAVVDGNVFRVLARVFGIATDILSTKGVKEFSTLATSLLPEKQSDTYNQGIMEFGALHCRPSMPECSNCPLSEICEAFRYDLQNKLPVKIKKGVRKERFFRYIIFKTEDGIFMRRRTKKDIWNNLFDFYLIEEHDAVAFKKHSESVEALKDFAAFSIFDDPSPVVKHILSHQTIYITFTNVRLKKKFNESLLHKYHLKKYTFEEAEHLPKPVPIVEYLKK